MTTAVGTTSAPVQAFGIRMPWDKGEEKPKPPVLREPTGVDKLVAYGVPVGLAAISALPAYVVGLKLGKSPVAGLLSAAPSLYFAYNYAKGALDNASRNPDIATPKDSHMSRGESIVMGAALGAATLGVAVAGAMFARNALGATFAGRTMTGVVEAGVRTPGVLEIGLLGTKGAASGIRGVLAGGGALQWGLTATAVGGALGAAIGATAREPQAVVKDMTKNVGISSIKWGGIAGAVAGAAVGGFVALKTHDIRKGIMPFLWVAPAAGLYVGTMAANFKLHTNAAASWAATPKR